MKNFLAKNKNTILKVCVEIAAVLLIWLIFFLVNKNVVFYHDDFANASLSYGYVVEGVKGTDFTWAQVMEWQSHIYQSWGGRVFYSTLLVYLCKSGPFWFYFTESIVLTLIVFFGSKLISKTFFQQIVSLFALTVFFFCISQTFQFEGAYWAAAVVCYIWPILPFLGGVYALLKARNSLSNKARIAFLIVGGACLVLTSLGHEVFGLLALLFLVIDFIFQKGWKDKKEIISKSIILVFVLIAAAVLILAPGNKARGSIYPEYYAKSLFQRIYESFPAIFNLANLSVNAVFGYALSIALLLAAIPLFKKTTKTWLKAILVCSSIIYCFAFLISPSVKGGLRFVLPLYCAVFQLIILVVYFWLSQNRFMAAWAVTVFAMAYVWVLSPVYGDRTTIPYLICLPTLFLPIFFEATRGIRSIKKKVFSVASYGLVSSGSIVLFLVAAITYTQTYVGYKENKKVWDFNEVLIQEYAQKESNDIYLFPYLTPFHAIMPYYSGYDYINDFMKSYYALPKETKLHWFDEDFGFFSKEKYVAGSSFVDCQLICGAYGWSNSSVWTKDRLAFCVTEDASFNLIFYNPFAKDNHVNVFVEGRYAGEFDVSANSYSGYHVQSVQKGVSHIAFTYSTFVPSSENPSGDSRDLGLLVWQEK